jgi:hypothetical protein
MSLSTQHIVRHLFRVGSLEEVSRQQLEELVEEYPSFGVGRYLLSRKLQDESAEHFNEAAQRTNIYFTNPFWLQWLLHNPAPAELQGPAAFRQEEPVDTAAVIYPEDLSIAEDKAPEPAEHTTDISVTAAIPEAVQEGTDQSSPMHTAAPAASSAADEVMKSIALIQDQRRTEQDTATQEDELPSMGIAGLALERAEDPIQEETAHADHTFGADPVHIAAFQPAGAVHEEVPAGSAFSGGSVQAVPPDISGDPVSGEVVRPDTPAEPISVEVLHNDTPAESLSEETLHKDISPESIPGETLHHDTPAEPISAEALHNDTPAESLSEDAVHMAAWQPAGSVHEEVPAGTTFSSASVDAVAPDISGDPVPEETLPPDTPAGPISVEALHNDTPAEPPATSPLFEPYYTVDYFASQGIRLVLDENPTDKLGKQMKSFTDWLKVMRRLPQKNRENIPDIAAEHQVQASAAHSIEGREVITETMAEVLAKQGKREKATEMYRKLSLLEPDKSAYFAEKIDQLKII